MPKRVPKFSRIIKPIMDHTIDALFESYASKKGKVSPVYLPPILRGVESRAEEILRRAGEIHREVSGIVGGESVPVHSIGYCLECCEKHFAKSSKLMEEAIQRLEAREPLEKVTEKVRAVVRELAGLEDDIPPTVPDVDIRELDRRARSLRKSMWEKRLSLTPTLEGLREAKVEIDSMLKETYNILERKEKKYFAGLRKGCEEWGVAFGWSRKQVDRCAELMRRFQKKELTDKEFKQIFESEFGKWFRVRMTKEGAKIERLVR